VTRRGFLEAIPFVQIVGGAPLAASPAAEIFAPVDLPATGPTTPVAGVASLRGGRRIFAGIPFQVRTSFLTLGRDAKAISIPLVRRCNFVCLAHFCEHHPDDTAGPFGAENPKSEFEPVGQLLATYSLVYEDRTRHDQPIRRRYEINPPGNDASHVPAAAAPSFEERYIPLDSPLASAYDAPEAWTSLARKMPPDFGPLIWIYAFENPQPPKRVTSLELKAAGSDVIAISALTLFHRPYHPLRREPLRRISITLPEMATDWRKSWKVDVDLGVVGRIYPVPDFAPAAWLDDPYKGLGEPASAVVRTNKLIAEVSASSAATLTITNLARSRESHYDLDQSHAEVQVMEPRHTWIHAAVIDESTGKPCAARVSFRSDTGRYIAPYGHPEDIAAGWMQNTGPDVRIGGASYAYVDGGFQIELPPGDIYVEAWKGFEFAPVRRKITITPGQKELTIPIARAFHAADAGWVTADTHVHIGSPQLLVLEGAAEGLNLVNLLAAQWGRYFTNFADPAGRFAGSSAETTVWVGSENRDHFLGHIGLLGVRSRITPFSGSGPPVAYYGAPIAATLADWADACRSLGGLTVGVHFPIPNGETAVDVVLGKLDAAEIRYDHGFGSLGVTEYYRYLNCGYRLAAVGGTDKMMSTRAVGAVRTYARLQRGQPFSFDAWASAVRSGRTFVTCGPLLFLEADGAEPGAVIDFRGERSIEVHARAESLFPLSEIEIVHNGRVVASGRTPLHEKLTIRDAGWLAARCTSRGRLSFGMRNIGAHTSPVYFTKDGSHCFSPRTAQYFLKLMEGAILWVNTLATPANRAQFERVQSLFREAHRSLEVKLQQHSHV
jgi:hypothetical protein